MKKTLSLALVVFIILSCSVVAYADGIAITAASNAITKSGSTVYLYQTTAVGGTATTIKHVKYLQRWTGSSWVTYSTATAYRYNSSYYSNSATKAVNTGYYYRVITYHYIYEGTTLVDAVVRTSSSIYVG